jgi:molybdate transport system substrate-binding protein
MKRIPELAAVPGVDVVGPFPTELQSYIVFSGGISSNAKDKAGPQGMEPG